MLQNRQVPWLEAQELDELYLDLNDGMAREEGVLLETEDFATVISEDVQSLESLERFKGGFSGRQSRQNQAYGSIGSHEAATATAPVPPVPAALLSGKARKHPRGGALPPVATSVLSSVTDGMRRLRQWLGPCDCSLRSGLWGSTADSLPVQSVAASVGGARESQARHSSTARHGMPRRLQAESPPPPAVPVVGAASAPSAARAEEDFFAEDADRDGADSRGGSEGTLGISEESRSSSSALKKDHSTRKEANKEVKEDKKKAKKFSKGKGKTQDSPAPAAQSIAHSFVPHAAAISASGARAEPRPRPRPQCVLAEERAHARTRQRLSKFDEAADDICKASRDASVSVVDEDEEAAEEMAVRTPSVASCSSERLDDEKIRSEELRPLRCHVLFSSPLCVERPVAVTVPVPPLPDSNLEAFFKSQYATWGFSFEPLEPARLLAVFGMAKEQNLSQTHAEAMLRPGDEVYKVIVTPATSVETTKPAATAPSASTSSTAPSTSSPARSAQPPKMQLAGGGLQSFVQNQPLFAVLARLLANQPRNCGPLNLQLIFRGMRPLPQLDVEEEVAEVRRSGCVALPGALTSENFRRLIAARDCEVLHLALHCSSGQAQHLYLEDMQGKAHVMASKDFEGLLRAGQDLQCIKLVVLNACHSLTVGQCFVAAGVQHVVCVRDDREVRDESCRSFTQNFFSALRHGRSVQEAFDCGVACLQHAASPIPQRDASAFLLLPEGDHSAVLTSAISRTSASQPSLPSRLPPVVEDFMGREVDLWRTMCLLKSRRLVSLSGVKGIGKTALLAALGHFIHLRCAGGCAFDQVYWLGGKTAADDFQRLLEMLQTTPDLNVLVIVNMSSKDKDGLSQPPVEELLNFSRKVRLIVETSNTWSAGGDVKSTPMPLGPLEPLLQARLFLQRAARPLYDFELESTHQPGQMPSSEPNLANISLQPRDLIAVAELPWIKALQGVPLRIVEMAQRLKTWEAAESGPGQVSGRVKLRAVRPDGLSRDVMLNLTTTLQEVVDKYSPSGLKPDDFELYVDDCLAPADATLSDFWDEKARLAGFITLHFRHKSAVPDW